MIKSYREITGKYLRANRKLGDSVKIADKDYTLVGILSDTYSNQADGRGELE